jgi:hypothetical protein
MIQKSCCRTFTAMSTAAHFVTCNLYLSRQLVRLMLKIVMKNGRDIMEVVTVYTYLRSSECSVFLAQVCKSDGHYIPML